LQEKDEAKAFFKSKKGKDLRKEIASTRTTDEDLMEEDEEEAGVVNGVGGKPKTAVRRGKLTGILISDSD
jgi:hypothetical protein